MQPVTELYHTYKQISSWQYIFAEQLKHSNLLWKTARFSSIIFGVIFLAYLIGQLTHFIPESKYDYLIASLILFFFLIGSVSWYWSEFKTLNQFNDVPIVRLYGREQLKYLLWLEKIKRADCYYLEYINDAIKKVEPELLEQTKDSSLKQIFTLLITIFLCMISWKLIDKFNLSLNDLIVIMVYLIALLAFGIILHIAINHEKKLLREFYKALKLTQSNFMDSTSAFQYRGQSY